ncbi:MAG TPA: hypothetical protein VME70_15800 [Mycobacteriales bacterium]|nr:hypothetical protein [Mycobacteriales bacterium]
MADPSGVVAEYTAAETGWHDASTGGGSSPTELAAAARRYVRAIEAYVADLRARDREIPARLEELAGALRERFGPALESGEEQVFKVFRLADGRWMAIKEDDRNPDNARLVRGWKDIEALRLAWRRTDTWAWSVLNAFMDEFGEPARPIVRAAEVNQPRSLSTPPNG